MQTMSQRTPLKYFFPISMLSGARLMMDAIANVSIGRHEVIQSGMLRYLFYFLFYFTIAKANVKYVTIQ